MSAPGRPRRELLPPGGDARSANDAPASAVDPAATFHFPVRIYYEDTDAAGVVYYANYLRFLERARTEWLSSLGLDLATLEREHGIAFAVHHVDIRYHQPARLGDRLVVSVTIEERGRARMVALQDVRRGAELLVDARVTLACLDRNNWRPARMPAQLVARMEKRD